MEKTENNIYEPFVTVYDKDSDHTACQGERCKLLSVYVMSAKSFAVLLNSQNNKLIIPFELFETVFYPSIDQKSKL